MKNIYILLFVLIFGLSQAQIGINNPTPNAKSELDITSTDKGILIPRLVRGTVAPLYGIATPVPNGMIVYQTDTASGTFPGYYFFNGGWLPVRGGATAWIPSGNAGINPTSNFIGTIVSSANPLSLRTNAINRVSVLQNGLVGINTIAPTLNLHVAGSMRLQDGTEGLGKLLVSDASGYAGWQTPASVGLVGWATTGNAGTNPTTNYLGTSDLTDFIIKTDNTEKFRLQSDGNIRINVPAATGSQLEVRANSIGIPVIRGVNTNTTPATFSFGVSGEIRSTNLGSNALNGRTANLNNESGIGVLGRYQTAGAGVFGRAWSGGFGGTVNTLFNYPTGMYVDFITGRDYGVYGLVDFPNGTGVYGKNSNTTLGSAYGMYCEGNMAATGVTDAPSVKSASVPTSNGNQLVYCKESPEMWFEDFGFGQLQNGSLHVGLDALFLETVFIDASHKMQVVLQDQAESNGLYFVIDADYRGFTVKERKNGTSDATFSYSIMAKRRFYQDQRFGVDANQPFENNLTRMKDAPVTTKDPMVMKAFIDKVTAEKNSLSKKIEPDTTEIKKEIPVEKQKETSKTSN